MTKIKLPGARVIFVPNHSSDHVIDLTNYPDIDSTISHEDTIVLGEYNDSGGSGGRPPQAVFNAGMANALQNDLMAEGRDFDRTPRGNNAAVFRQKPKSITVQS